MLAELIMTVYRELYGEGGGVVVGTGSPDLYRVHPRPITITEKGGGRGRGQPVHVNIRRGPTLG